LTRCILNLESGERVSIPAEVETQGMTEASTMKTKIRKDREGMALDRCIEAVCVLCIVISASYGIWSLSPMYVAGV